MLSAAKARSNRFSAMLREKIGYVKPKYRNLRFHGNFESKTDLKKKNPMKRFLIIIATVILVLAILSLFVRPLNAQGLGNCTSDYTHKTDGESLVTDITGRWVKAVIKAGSQNQGEACFEFTVDSDDGCYAVSGLGTDTAHASKIGEGRDCKDISHVEWVFDPGQSPTPQPTVYPLPSEDPTASPSATPDPSPTPEVSPTPSPSTEVTPKPSPTPSVEEQQQQMIEEVKKENGGVMPQLGYK